MTKLCIFSFYNKNGYVADYVSYLLKELKTVADRIIFVANGFLSNEGKNKVQEFTKEILVRDNLGFDAGAYKYALVDYLKTDLSGIDEMIFCNDTFWGPFVSMQSIFSKMKKEECDLWGLGFVKNNYVNFIPSFFLVFRRRIISDGSMIDYIAKNFDESSNDIHNAYAVFETGLFDYLTRIKLFTFSYYTDIQNINIYRAPSYLLRNCAFPILKRRCLSAKYFNVDKIIDSLDYIKNNTQYNYRIILNDLEKSYSLKIDENSIRKKDVILDSHCFFYYNHCEQTSKEIEDFIEKSNGFYIYGAGIIGCRVYWRYAHNNKNFKGFIVSDGKMENENEFMKERLFHASDLSMKGKRILVSVNIENIHNIKEILEGAVTYYI